MESVKDRDQDEAKAQDEQADIEPATLLRVVNLLQDQIELIVMDA